MASASGVPEAGEDQQIVADCGGTCETPTHFEWVGNPVLRQGNAIWFHIQTAGRDPNIPFVWVPADQVFVVDI